MNDLIKQLALQATAVVDVTNPDTTATHHRQFFDLEKFAELIVQECLMKATGAKIRGETIDQLIVRIKEDFGVEND